MDHQQWRQLRRHRVRRCGQGLRGAPPAHGRDGRQARMRRAGRDARMHHHHLETPGVLRQQQGRHARTRRQPGDGHPRGIHGAEQAALGIGQALLLGVEHGRRQPRARYRAASHPRRASACVGRAPRPPRDRACWPLRVHPPAVHCGRTRQSCVRRSGSTPKRAIVWPCTHSAGALPVVRGLCAGLAMTRRTGTTRDRAAVRCVRQWTRRRLRQIQLRGAARWPIPGSRRTRS